MAEVSGWLGPITTLIAALGTLPLAAFAQNRGENRVRVSIENSIKTLKEIDGLPLSNNTALVKRLEQRLESDLDALARKIDARNEQKSRNWPSLAAAIFLAALITLPMWFMWRPQVWWTWTIFVGLGIGAAFTVLLGIFALLSQPHAGKPIRT